jgi:gluconokinase
MDLAAIRPDPPPPAIVVMGVSGSGKTAVGGAIAARLGLPLVEGDAFHPPANVAKMSSGTPLTDEDRWPWLDAIAAAIREAPGGVVVACSALRKAYRDRLRTAAGRPLLFVFLDGKRETIAARLAARKGHFMPASLLDSQFATLERPLPVEADVVRIGIEPLVDRVVDEVLDRLAERRTVPGNPPVAATGIA